MGHDVGHTLTSHGHHEGLRALPRNPMECAIFFDEVGDHVLLVPLNPAGDHGNQDL